VADFTLLLSAIIALLAVNHLRKYGENEQGDSRLSKLGFCVTLLFYSETNPGAHGQGFIIQLHYLPLNQRYVVLQGLRLLQPLTS
jgi:hypothetical protein